MRFKPSKPDITINWQHPSANGLVGCWLWNENPIHAKDLTGRANPAIGFNTPTHVSGTYMGGLAVQYTAASSERSSVAATPAMNVGATGSVEVWVKYTGTEVARMIVSRDDEGSNRCFHLRVNSGQIQVVSFPSVVNFLSPTVYNDGLWHQLVLVLGRGILGLYVDGESTNAAACTDTWPATTIPLDFGCNRSTATPTSFWTGSIWLARMWNRYLTKPEVRKLFHDPSGMFEEPVYQRLPLVAASGAQTLTLPTLASGAALFAPTLAREGLLTPPSLASAAALFAPAVKLRLSGATIASGSTLFAPSVGVEQLLTLPTLASGAQLIAPSAVKLNVTTATIASGSQLFSPSVEPVQILTLPTIASTAALFSPSVELTASLPTIASGATVNAPTVTQNVTTATIAAGSTLTGPTLSLNITLTLPFISSGETLFAPTVVAEGGLTLPHISSGETFFAPSLTQNVTLATLSSGATLTPPTLGLNVTLPLLASGSQLFAPSMAVAEGGLTLPLIGSGETLFAPSLSWIQFVTLVGIAQASQLYPPTVAVADAPVAVAPALTEEQRAQLYRRQQQNREDNKVAQERALRGSDAAYRELVGQMSALLPWEGSNDSERAGRAYTEARERALAGDPAALAALKAETSGLLPWDGWDPVRRVRQDGEE